MLHRHHTSDIHTAGQVSLHEQPIYFAAISSMIQTSARASGNGQQDAEAKAAEGREMLRKHFLTISPDQQVNEWEYFWKKGITPWDREGPNPAFVEALSKQGELLGSPFREVNGMRTRKQALVPGCGRGGYRLTLIDIESPERPILT